MIFNRGELSGLAAVSGGRQLVGLPSFPLGRDEVDAALKGLITKGLLSADGHVTKLGVVPVWVMQHYWQADRHIQINQTRLSVNTDGTLSVLLPVETGWYLARMRPERMMLSLLKGFPWLRSNDGAVPTSEWESLLAQDWVAKRSPGGGEPALVVHESSAAEKWSRTVVFDSVDGVGFAFDVDGSVGQSLPVPAIRNWIAGLLGCVAGPEMGGYDD